MNLRKSRSIAAMIMLTCATAFHSTAQKMITFESSSSSRSSSKAHRGGEGKNSLSVGLGSALNGYLPLYYERTLSPSFTIQAGAGITFRSFPNDLGMMVYNDGNESDYFTGADARDITDNYSTYKYRKVQIGQYFSVSPKYYFRQSALDGAYICPMFELKNFRYKAEMANETVDADDYSFFDDSSVPRTKNYFSEKMRCIDLTFNVGGHFQSSGNVSLGWSVGLGVRSISSDRLDVGTVTDALDNETFVNKTYSFTATRPLFVFNFIMGGWF